MKKELVVINVLLLAVVIGAVFQSLNGWTAFGISHDPEAIQYEGEAFGSPLVPDTEGGRENPDWARIAEENLFSYDRNDLSIAPPENPVATGPRPILFGTMSIGDGPIALLATGQPGNTASMPYQVGESIDGWQVLEIVNKSVVVESGGVRSTVLMNDPTAQVPRGTARTLASGSVAPQVSTVGAGAPGPTVQSSTTSTGTRASVPSPSEITEENVPPGFRIQRTPGFGNRIVPIP